MTNMLHKYFDELQPGDAFRSRGRTVTEADIVNWCSWTGDWFVLHSDAHYAAQTRFGQRIAPGLMILAYAAGLGIPPDAPAIVANYGTDQLRFTGPTFIGDTIHLEAKIKELIVKHPGRDGVVRLSWDVYNQNGVQVLASDLQILMSFRGSAN